MKLLYCVVLTVLFFLLNNVHGYRFSGWTTSPACIGWTLPTIKPQHKKVLATAMLSLVLIPGISSAEYDENLQWIGPPEQSWGDRLNKAKTMSRRDIMMAAKGAGNRDKLDVESPKAKKRRAMAACRAPEFRDIAKVSEISCINRVTKGEIDFILETMDK